MTAAWRRIFCRVVVRATVTGKIAKYIAELYFITTRQLIIPGLAGSGAQAS
jgi:hypothetical protein